MECISWNVRGLGRPEKKRVVSIMVKKYKPSFLFKQETKVSSVDYRIVNFLGGGILHKGELVTLKKEIVICNIYAPNMEEDRVVLWDFILANKKKLAVPWFIRGDFNVILEALEKSGGPHIRSHIRHFRKFIEDAMLVNLPMQGFPFTWSNSREVASWACLDRFLVSLKFLHWFHGLFQRNLSKSILDHSVVWIDISKEVCGAYPFRYFDSWMENNDIMEVARKEWRKKLLGGSKDYRPIGLANSLYKVLARVLSNRLWKVMNGIIGEAQMAFVEKRQIIDSFVIANEVISSWIKEKNRGIVLKSDFEKASDSVDHKFLDLCLQGMGFGVRWREWMHSVIASPMISILINGSP
ncbi:hypothetical protein Dsin_028047 [Dipteronia sinensis]|uniref:Reverse transcriptase domain-containing protein n=1 Tax=Dipteronia sinensis TaxID=43782 RepID=A0AAE0DU58_9ROSI|nr:hypothetical protein Dsin_028047 [Dipteronia sinensis]